MKNSIKWHTKSAEESLEITKSDEIKGLSQKEAEERLKKYGKNELLSAPKTPWYIIFSANLQISLSLSCL